MDDLQRAWGMVGERGGHGRRSSLPLQTAGGDPPISTPLSIYIALCNQRAVNLHKAQSPGRTGSRLLEAGRLSVSIKVWHTMPG